MEHRLTLGDEVAPISPLYSRSLFRAVKICHFRVEYERPTAQSLGAGQHSRMDLLVHHLNTAMYEELAAETDIEEVDG
ncbi:hypothetical protein PG991_002989 [Apiospora marii]|uniref:KaiA C-terminal domain-containing protein n=1 Tax=Apiospora marii TaxID=335849 RepID=A0ABR1SI82_9PEZI